MALVYLGLGANADPETNLREGVRLLAQRVELLGVSSVYRSPAVGDAVAAPYWNAVACVRTPLAPADLKQVLREIEDALGRVRRLPDGRKSPVVTFDADILWAEGNDQPPHADIATRAYVAVPLAELVPEWRHPQTGETALALAQRLNVPPLERLDVRLDKPL